MEPEEEKTRTCYICQQIINPWESACYKCIPDEPGEEHWLDPVRLD